MEDLRKRLEAYEIVVLLTHKVTTVKVLWQMHKMLELVSTIKQRKFAYLGHVFEK